MKRRPSLLEILSPTPGQPLNLLPNEAILVTKSIKPKCFLLKVKILFRNKIK